MKPYTLLIPLLAAACASKQPSPKPVVWTKDAELAPVLTAPELTKVQMAKVDTLASLLPDFDDRLQAAVVDTTNPPLVRTNAILLIADRRAGGQVEAFLSALEANDEDVRAAAVVGLRNYFGVSSTVDLLKGALRDPSPLVQARALESLADRDPDILREYIANARNAELKAIAQDLIAAAESRGAPLVPVDTLGTLRRSIGDDIVLTYSPVTRWRSHSASLGSLTLTIGKTPPIKLADSVEVVRNVLPAFFSGDAKHVVYESNRNIYVRDVDARTTRRVGPGIAPRVLPFTNTFVYAQEKRRTDNPQGAGITYDLFRTTFTEGESTPIGEAGAHAQTIVAGGFSPLRWARIIEQDGHFVLVGESLDEFRLPDPFASGAD